MDNNAKTIFWWFLNAGLIVVMFVGIAAASVLRNQVSPQRTITISGEGRVVAIPDIATVSFSVLSEGNDPALLQKENTEQMNRAIKFIKDQGIADKDIKTTQYSLYPRYDFVEFLRRSVISGYTLTQSVTVKIRDFAKVAPIVGGLPELGINQISGAQFDVEEEKKEQLLADARNQAFGKAYEKARAMAKVNGVRIRRVVTFSESGGFPPIYRFADALAAKGGEGPLPAPVPSIEPGSQEIAVQVNVTYEIR